MAEKTRIKMIVDGMDLGDAVITSEADIELTEWTALPLTLRDDAVELIEEAPEEDEVFSHENDAAEEFDITGAGTTASGSFIRATLTLWIWCAMPCAWVTMKLLLIGIIKKLESW